MWYFRERLLKTGKDRLGIQYNKRSYHGEENTHQERNDAGCRSLRQTEENMGSPGVRIQEPEDPKTAHLQQRIIRSISDRGHVTL